MRFKFSKKLKIASLLGLGVASIGIATPLIVSCSDDGNENSSSNQIDDSSVEFNPEYGGTPQAYYLPSDNIKNEISFNDLRAANYGCYVGSNAMYGIMYDIIYGNNKYNANEHFEISNDFLIRKIEIIDKRQSEIQLFDEKIKIEPNKKFVLEWKVNFKEYLDFKNDKSKSWEEIIEYSIDNNNKVKMNKKFDISTSSSYSIINNFNERKLSGKFYVLNGNEKSEYLDKIKLDKNSLEILSYYDIVNGYLYGIQYDDKIDSFYCIILYINKNTQRSKLSIPNLIDVYGQRMNICTILLHSIENYESDLTFENPSFIDLNKYFPKLNEILIYNSDWKNSLKQSVEKIFNWTKNNWTENNNVLIASRK